MTRTEELPVVSVLELLPDHGDLVLVTYANGDIGISSYDNERRVWMPAPTSESRVAHWRPLDIRPSLRIAVALAECAPTRADRYDYSAKEPSELVGLVRSLRERAEKAELELARLVEQLAEVTGKRALAEIEAGRLREACEAMLEADDAESRYLLSEAIDGVRQALAKGTT